MRLKALFWLSPFLAIAMWISFDAFKSLYPTDALCGRIVMRGEDAFQLAIGYMETQRYIMRSSVPTQELKQYQSENKSCCSAVYSPSEALFNPGHWYVHMELPTRCGYLVDYVFKVYECGGAAEIIGKTPVDKNAKGDC